MNAYMTQYQNNQILTASPEQILIMLYDGAIRFCRQAMTAMDEGDKVVQSQKTSKAMAIVCEFANTLDHKVGGEIAEDLDALYGFMTRELTRAGRENDRKALETVETLLVELREAWVEAALIQNQAPQEQTVQEPVEQQAAQPEQAPQTTQGYPPAQPKKTPQGYGPAGQATTRTSFSASY